LGGRSREVLSIKEVIASIDPSAPGEHGSDRSEQHGGFFFKFEPGTSTLIGDVSDVEIVLGDGEPQEFENLPADCGTPCLGVSAQVWSLIFRSVLSAKSSQ
jgi:hypothetical protein